MKSIEISWRELAKLNRSNGYFDWAFYCEEMANRCEQNYPKQLEFRNFKGMQNNIFITSC